MNRWTPPATLTRKEEFRLKRPSRTKAIRVPSLVWRELFGDACQDELETMYRQTGAGSAEPLPPARLCMVLLLQAYTGISHAEAVDLTIVDTRWQLVLACMSIEIPLV